MATGGDRQLAAQHSLHSFEGWFAHVPGLKGAAPRRSRMRRMLAAALADPNPVLLFEHIMLRCRG